MLKRTLRRYGGWWLLTTAAAASAVAGLVGQSLPLLTGSVLVGALGGVAGLLTAHAQRAISRNDSVRTAPLRRVRDLHDPVAVGIHRALPPSAGEQQVPPFVARDESAVLEDLLGASRFVLVVGESTAGKSRMAYEAMRARLPGHVFIFPQGKHDLGDALRLAAEHRRSVLWLDDLESYLGIGGLTPDGLSSLLAAPGRHTVVMATMRAHQRATYTVPKAAGPVDDETGALVLAGKVLALAHEVRVERQWSEAELGRASAVDDGRIGQALQHASEFGIAQYLTAAPELFKLWQDTRGSAPEGRPRAVALVAAAVDARRAGYHGGIPLDVLRRLHELYLNGSSAHVRLETWEEAVDWATSPLYSTSSLLMPADQDRYIAFDYLADAVDAAIPAPELPTGAWEVLTSFVPAGDIIEVAWAAFHRHQPLVAEAALQQAFDAGYFEAALDFAAMLHGSERDEEVVAWLEKAIAHARDAGLSPEQVLDLRSAMAWWAGGRLKDSGDPATAREIAEKVVAESTRMYGQRHPRTLSSRLVLARQIGSLGDHAAALAIATDVKAAATRLDDRDLLWAARFEIAVWTREGGDPSAAVGLWQEIVAEMVSAEEMSFTDSLLNIAGAVDETGDPEFGHAVIRWLERLFASMSDVETRMDVYMEVGSFLAWWTGGRGEGHGDHARAGDLAQQLTEIGTGILGPNAPQVLTTRLVLAHALGMLGDPARALAISEEVAGTATRVYGPGARVTTDANGEVRRWKPNPGVMPSVSPA